MPGLASYFNLIYDTHHTHKIFDYIINAYPRNSSIGEDITWDFPLHSQHPGQVNIYLQTHHPVIMFHPTSPYQCDLNSGMVPPCCCSPKPLSAMGVLVPLEVPFAILWPFSWQSHCLEATLPARPPASTCLEALIHLAGDIKHSSLYSTTIH